MYEKAMELYKKPHFTEGVIAALGKLGDVIKRFIETQLEDARQHFITLSLPDDFASSLLDEFATEDGTKKACKAIDLSKILKQDVKTIKKGLVYFDEKKLLRADEEDVERYEPVHDVIANQIHKLRKAEDKEFKTFTRQLKNDYERWVFEHKTAQRFLTESDVAKVDIYRERFEQQIDFTTTWGDFIDKSKQHLKDIKTKGRRRFWIVTTIAVLAIITSIVAYFFYKRANIKTIEAESAKKEAIVEKEKAEKALKQLIITEIEKLSNRVDVITKSGNACPDVPMMEQLKSYKDTYKNDEAIMKLINEINGKLQSKKCPTL
jgi:hypothetical protein